MNSTASSLVTLRCLYCVKCVTDCPPIGPWAFSKIDETEGQKVMSCPVRVSGNQPEFPAEMLIHFKDVATPGAWIFSKLLVGLN